MSNLQGGSNQNEAECPADWLANPNVDISNKDTSAAPLVEKQSPDPSPRSLVLSTLLSLTVVLVLLVAIRFFLPAMLENARYAWFRGQLRAEYENSRDTLQNVSLDGSWHISQLVHQRVSPSVVHINLRNSEKYEPIMELLRQNTNPESHKYLMVGQGSGVIVDGGGYILTNNHVIADGGDIEVFLSDGRHASASIHGVDRETDIAILKIDATDLIPIEWGDSDLLETGAPVWAVGSPFGLAGSITFGILSGKHRADLSATRYRDADPALSRYGDLMQSDVAVNPGNSGGPLVDAKGRLIGINTAILGENYQGVSFSIPSNVAKHVYEKILATGKMERGWLGVSLRTASIHPLGVAGDKSSRGAVVESFVGGKKSPGREAGLIIGDTILGFDGKEVTDSLSLIRMIGEAHIGDKIELKIERDGKPLNVTFEVGTRPPGMQR